MTTTEVSTIARQRVDRIKTGVEVVWHLIVESYQARDWLSLGYSSWDEMCTREFGTSRLRLPREERAETVQSLRESGLSIRAIAAVTGDSKSTIAETTGVQNRTPVRALEPVAMPPSPSLTVVDRATGEVIGESETGRLQEAVDKVRAAIVQDAATDPEPLVDPPIRGLDGKTYHRPQAPKKPPRKPITEVAKTRGFALRQAMDSVLNVTGDDRYRTNEKQVADVLRGHLLYVAETVAAVLDQLP